MPKRVIINADDFGFSAGINEGIIVAHRRGVLTSTTLATNMPAAADALARLAEAPNLGVGIHLNVCQGPALSELGRARLADPRTGQMNRTAQKLATASLFRRGLVRAIEAEYDAQIRWAIERGLRPTHLDSHRHTHAFPTLFRAACRLARRHNIRFVRWPIERLPGKGWPATTGKQRNVARLLRMFGWVDRLFVGRLRGTAGTWGIAHTGAISAEWLTLAAERGPQSTLEIMVHPGYSRDLAPAISRLTGSRDLELDALCDPAVRTAFQRAGVELIHYGQLV
jgi:predicted glycoside hydrolase/deacetylase ChbG (UPF0249 family)